jgi:hypothetical protein
VLGVFDKRIAANGDDNRLHPEFRARVRIKSHVSSARPVSDSKSGQGERNRSLKANLAGAKRGANQMHGVDSRLVPAVFPEM